MFNASMEYNKNILI